MESEKFGAPTFGRYARALGRDCGGRLICEILHDLPADGRVGIEEPFYVCGPRCAVVWAHASVIASGVLALTVEVFVPKSTPLLDTISAKRSFAVSDQKTRRFFLGALTAASAVRVWGANDKVNVGIVGLGGRGSSHLNTYTGLSEARVVA